MINHHAGAIHPVAKFRISIGSFAGIDVLVSADSLKLIGLNISEADRAALAGHEGIHFAEYPAANDSETGTYLFVGSHPPESAIEDSFKPPFRGFFEYTNENDPIPAELISTTSAGGLGIFLTTRSAFSCHIAHHLCDAVFRNITINAELGDGIRFATEEAISNAILHGNLQVDGSLRNTLTDFERYTLMIDDRLADPAFGGRRILVVSHWDDEILEISIRDEGNGYKAPVVEKGKPSGRGLQIITSVASSVDWSEEGRRFTMRFEY